MLLFRLLNIELQNTMFCVIFIRSFQKFFRLEFPSANWHGEFKKSEIWHEGSLRCYPKGTILLFAISGIFMEFWGIFGEYPPIFDIFVERAPVKLGFECFLSEYGLGGRPRHFTTRIWRFGNFREFSGIFRNFQSWGTVAQPDTDIFLFLMYKLRQM